MQADTPDVSYLDVPMTPCLAEVDARGWVQTVGLRAGEHVLGVRCSSGVVADLVRELFAERHVEGVAPPPNLSLWLAPDASSGPRPLHALYRAHIRMERGRDPRRALDTLWHELDGRDRVAQGQRIFDLTVLLRRGEAHLFPGWLRVAVIDDQRGWERAGFQVLERRWVEVDLPAGEIVVPQPVSEQRPEAVRDGLVAAGIALPGDRAPWGRIPIASWNVEATSPAARVGALAVDLAGEPQRITGEVLRDLAAHVDSIPSLEVELAPDGLRRRIAAAVG